MKRYVVALDQGTTSSRCIVFDKEQQVIGMAQKEYTQLYPQPGWVEHDPMEIYSSQYGVLMETLADWHNAGGDCGGGHYQSAGNHYFMG